MKFITVSSELEKACLAKMEETLNICRKKYNVDIPPPPLKFAQIGRRAGICRYVMPNRINNNKFSATIIINPDYFKNHYDDMLNDTVPHEVAHYVSACVFGREGVGHGWRWKSVMHVIGLAGDRCHEYSLEGVKTRTVEKPFKYACNCVGDKGIHMVTRNLHHKHQASVAAGRKGYRCTRCRSYLRLDVLATKELPAATFVQLFNVPAPTPVVPKPEQPKFRVSTRFVDGILVNVQVPL